jgi:hypothetical protein
VISLHTFTSAINQSDINNTSVVSNLVGASAFEQVGSITEPHVTLSIIFQVKIPSAENP